jgi:Ras-related protein Rab-6A/Rab family protein
MLSCVLIGSEGVGKTTMLNCFIHGTSSIFCQPPPTTVNCVRKEVDQRQNLMLQIWDTSGKQQFWYLRVNACTKSQYVFVCFDLGNRQSFLDVEHVWMQELKQNNLLQDKNLLLVGCKQDQKRTVSNKEVEALCKKWNIKHYVETCGLYGNNEVSHLFFKPLADLGLLVDNKKFQAQKKNQDGSKHLDMKCCVLL